MHKAFRLVGRRGLSLSRYVQQASPPQYFLRPASYPVKACSPASQVLSQGFASSADNSKIDQALRKAIDSHDAQQLLEVVERHGKEFREADVITAFTSMTKWKDSAGNSDVLHSKPFQTLVDMVIMGLKRFSNSELTSVIKAAGTLQFDDDMLLDRTSQQLMLSVHKMSAEELYNLATGLAELEHSPSVVLFDAIQERAAQVSDDFNPEQKKDLEKAYQKLEYDHETISKALPDTK